MLHTGQSVNEAIERQAVIAGTTPQPNGLNRNILQDAGGSVAEVVCGFAAIEKTWLKPWLAAVLTAVRRLCGLQWYLPNESVETLYTPFTEGTGQTRSLGTLAEPDAEARDGRCWPGDQLVTWSDSARISRGGM